jgi:hypothetical protein
MFSRSQKGVNEFRVESQPAPKWWAARGEHRRRTRGHDGGEAGPG